MTAPLIFGVFPLGLAGAPGGLVSGPPDDFEAIGRALEQLSGGRAAWLARTYVSWAGRAGTAGALAQIGQLTAGGGPWDLVLCYRDRAGDVRGWQAFVAEVVGQYGQALAAIQVTAEANLTGVPAAADGDYPGARAALVRGVLRAADAKRQAGARAAIGFAVSPEVDPEGSGFWPEVRRLGGSDFAAAAEYAGIDMYPDVFGPPAGPDRLPASVDWVLRTYRERDLPAAGIGPQLPIRVCENGWPTGPGRPEDQQARVLETIVRAVSDRRAELNVTHWELFGLRDADSAGDSLFCRFGVLRDDYSAKPAFGALQRLYAELGPA